MDYPEQNGKRLIAEAFILHFRNLIDFFHVEANGKDDIVATDFTAPGMWNPARPPWFSAERTRCHKLMAHLTYSRIVLKDESRMTWNFERMAAHVEATWAAFLAAVPSERRGWFQGWRF